LAAAGDAARWINSLLTPGFSKTHEYKANRKTLKVFEAQLRADIRAGDVIPPSFGSGAARGGRTQRRDSWFAP
jgi:hypothetical protein